MRYLPNIITCFRILGSIVLLLLKPQSITFFIIYILCGATDIFDGYIARKTKNTSKSGAALDSVADIIFIAVMFYIFKPLISFAGWVVIWIIGIASTRILSLIIGYVKFRAIASLHTYGNKATGLILFFFPFIYQLCGITKAEYIILVIASLSALEEIVIIVTSRELNVNVKGIFLK